MSRKNEIVEVIVSLNTSLSARFYFYLQCTHPDLNGWFDWMPDNKLKRFTFEADARQEMSRLATERQDQSWRVVFTAEVSEVLP